MEAAPNQLASLYTSDVNYSFVVYSLLANSVCFVFEVAMQPDYYSGATQYECHSCIERENGNCKYVSNRTTKTPFGASSSLV